MDGESIEKFIKDNADVYTVDACGLDGKTYGLMKYADGTYGYAMKSTRSLRSFPDIRGTAPRRSLLTRIAISQGGSSITLKKMSIRSPRRPQAAQNIWR